MTKRRRPPLTPEDEALWQAFTRDIRRLDRKDQAAADPPANRVRRPRSRAAMAETDLPASTPTPSSIDRRHQRRLGRGQAEIDSELDLHGRTQEKAFALLLHHIRRAYHQGQRNVLVVTGKGGKRFRQLGDMPAEFRTRSDFSPEGGVLKRMVPLWLEGPDLAPFVQSFGPAHDRHGGAGAFYVLLRRPRGPRQF